MRQPRRIFRGAAAARPRMLGRTVLAGALGALGTAALVTMGLSSDLFGRASPALDHFSAEPSQVAVIDGDTLRLDGRVVRLRGVNAPMRGDTCGGARDCGGAATAALAGLVRDRRVGCKVTGQDAMGRPFAACDANGTDLSRAIVASGWARAQAGAPELADLELRARRQGAGLWSTASH